MKYQFAIMASMPLLLGVAAFQSPTDTLTHASATPAFEDTPRNVSFAHVEAVFRKHHCINCHTVSPRASAGLHLVTPARIMKGGKDGAVVVPGKPDESLLFKRVTATDRTKMPPGSTRLTQEEVETIRQWIADGAEPGKFGDDLENYYVALLKGDWKKAAEVSDAIGKMSFDDVSMDERSAALSLTPFAQLGNEAGWYKAAEIVVREKKTDDGTLNRIAWTIADPNGMWKRKDADLAIKAALQAVEGTRRSSGAILDTLAWSYHLKGDDAMAVKTEKEAMTCSDAKGDVLKAMEDALKTFGG
ncbi:MAG TPA: c-type cytochrome domain-containing protein [Fimbriimonadaceae bacterium]|nr:c-type cytochrome domain-containing protein [Fimbriimonadaceae bacterium]